MPGTGCSSWRLRSRNGSAMKACASCSWLSAWSPKNAAAREGSAPVAGRTGPPAIVAKLAAMHAREPALTRADLRAVPCRTLVMVADDDEVRLEHAIEAYRSLPDAELAVVPGTSHGLLVEKPELCNLLITEFLTKEPVETFAPIRRAARKTG